MATNGKARAGQLGERVVLLSPGAPVPDGEGGSLPGGADVAREVWARVEPLSIGAGLTQGLVLTLGLVLTQAAYRVTLRAEVGPVTATRLRWGAVTMAIKSVTASEDRTTTVLICQDSGQ